MIVNAKLPLLTKTEIDANTFQVNWKTNDVLGIFYTPDGVDKKLINCPFKSSDCDGKSQAEFLSSMGKVEFEEDIEKHTVYAVYPYNYEYTNANAYPFAVPTTVNANKFPGLFLVGKKELAEKVTEENRKIDVELSTPLAMVKLVIDTKDFDFDPTDVNNIVFSPTIHLFGNATYNFETGVMSGFDAREVSIGVDESSFASGKVTVYFTAKPSEGVTMVSNMVITMQGTIMDYFFDVNRLEDEFLPGVLNVVEINAKEMMDADRVRTMPKGDVPKSVANSYMLKPNGSIIIPVSRAYEVWRNQFGEEIGTGKTLGCKLIWVDTEGGLASTSAIKHIEMIKSEKEAGAGIYVKAGSAEGNAVIAFTVNDEIKWSWHIWVSNYEPLETVNQNQVAGFTLMSRNLGAISDDVNNINSFGLAYQWGRKDPFPGSDGIERHAGNPMLLNHYRDVFDANGNLIGGGDFTPINISDPTSNPEIIGIANSVRNPFTFYAGTKPPFLWTTSMNLDPSLMKNDLWNNIDNTKTVYDPCPEGWRVITSPTVPAALKLLSITVSGRSFDLGAAGRYPLTGFIECGSDKKGYWMDVDKTAGNIWIASTGGPGGRIIIFRIKNGVNEFLGDMESSLRSYGSSVRCQKE